MNETLTMWIEVTFDVIYLALIWFLVGRMYLNRSTVSPSNRKVAILLLWAFALLALGDTGHVGFRVLAYASGGLAESARLLGMGKLATSVTVTILYALFLVIWQARYNRPYGWFGYSLLAAAVVRLALLVPAANQWTSANPDLTWVLYRNLPLLYQGLGVAILFLVDAARNRDKAFRWISYMIFTSYAFYMIAVFFSQQIPLLGMLMMPKTVAYVVMAFIAYFSLFAGHDRSTVALHDSAGMAQ